MLEFTDAPYAFYPAKPIRPLMWLGRQVNRQRVLRAPHHQIARVTLSGADLLDEARAHGEKRWFFLANHSTHSDPQILTEVQRRLGVYSCYMAAHDVFHRGRLLAWFMQRSGCFSVNRDGNDSRSMREAMRILTANQYALSVFPEGNVYLMNDRLSPFLDGAAFMGLKAQKELGSETPIYVVPVSIKATHLSCRRPVLRERLERMAKDLGTTVDPDAPLTSEIKRVGMAALERSLRQRGLMPQSEPTEGDVRVHLEHCAELMIGRLEEKMTLPSRSASSLQDRVRKIRSRIHKIRTDPDARADHQVAATWADEAMIALRILSYAGDYLADQPTLDRCSETIEKLLEDVYSEVQPPCGEREALVQINAPINLTDHLTQFAENARQCVSQLTATFESRIQGGLDTIAETNQAPGNQRI